MTDLFKLRDALLLLLDNRLTPKTLKIHAEAELRSVNHAIKLAEECLDELPELARG